MFYAIFTFKQFPSNKITVFIFLIISPIIIRERRDLARLTLLKLNFQKIISSNQKILNLFNAILQTESRILRNADKRHVFERSFKQINIV